MERNLKRQLFAWIFLTALLGTNFGECDPLPRRSGGHSGGSFGSRVRSSLFGGRSSGAKSSFGGSYPRQGGLSSGSYPRQSGISSSYPKQGGSSHPGYTPFSSNPYSSRGNTGFSGSYPRQGGVGSTFNRPAYSSSYPTSSRGGGLLGGGLGGGLGGASSFARPATSRIGGRDMLKIGAGVAGGYLAGKAISNMFSGGHYPNGYWRDQDRYYYDQQQDRYYDSRRQQYSQAPPCDKPAAGANTTDWQMYSECLEYFNAYRNQYQGGGGGGGGGYGGGGYYGAGVISASASSPLIAVLLATVLSYYVVVAGVFSAGRRSIMLTPNNESNRLLCS